MGYHRAGFDVVGVDIWPQPRYPFEFHREDAMTFPLDGFDAIHASPPCEDHMRSRFPGQQLHGTAWMLPVTRDRLTASGLPWIIENVPGAPMRADYKLCGCMFGLQVSGAALVRERWFETSWRGFDLRAPCHHTEPAITIAGEDMPSYQRARISGSTRAERHALRQRVTGIDWMLTEEIGLAIPPAYTKYIGLQLLEHLRERAA
jgi:DNA (cytosine-5)-methyltransferase 1